MLQIMKRQILVNIREKSNIFWTMLFPLILATLFHFTLGGTIGENAMEDIRAAFVTDQNADSQEEEAFLKYLESFDQDWFQIIPMSQEEAREALKNDEILGIFYGGHLHTFPMLVIHNIESTVCDDDAVASSEAVFDETGKVQTLLNQHHWVFAGFLCVLHQFQHIGCIVQGALFHFLVIKGKVLRGVSGIHAKRLF